MQNRKKVAVLLVIMAAWLLLMWRLSSADGTETLRDSMRFARKIGSWIYDTPTDAQLNHLNLVLRKMAHIFLFAVLGGILGMIWQLLLEKRHWLVRILPAAATSTCIAFADELQKIPIAGRHFDRAEAFLNAASAFAVILCVALMAWAIRCVRRKSRKK